MKFNKLLLKKYKINKNSKKTEFLDLNNNILNETQMFDVINERIIEAIKTHNFSVKKSIRPNIEKFIKNEETLYELLKKELNYSSKIQICTEKYYENWKGKNKEKIIYDIFETKINAFTKYDKICKIFEKNKANKKLEPYEKFYIPEILSVIEKKFGKHFLKYVGNIFINRNLKIDNIMSYENSYVNVLKKSILGNKVNVDNTNLPDDVLENIFYNVEIPDFYDKIRSIFNKYSKEFLTGDVNIKKCKLKIINKNGILEKITRTIISEVNDLFYRRCLQFKSYDKYKNKLRGIRKKILKMISDDFRYFLNKSSEIKTIDVVCEQLEKIINEKIKIIKKYNLNFVLLESYYVPQNKIFKQEHKIISHSIFKLYKNLAIIVGSNIINYNSNNVNDLKDFSDEFEKFQVSNYLENFNSWDDNNWKNNFTNDYICSSIIIRNMVIHQKEFGKWKDNKVEKQYIKELKNHDKILNQILEKYNEQRIEVLRSYNIEKSNNSCLELFEYDKFKISVNFKRFFKKALNNKNKTKPLIKLINNIQNDSLSNKDISQRALAKKYLLKQVYNNNFQKWLENSNDFNISDFTNWYKDNKQESIPNQKLSFPVFKNCTYLNAQKDFDNYVLKWTEESNSEKKQESLKKRKSLIDYFTLYCFEKFLDNQKTVLQNIENLIYKTLIQNKEECNDEIVKIFILSSLNLSNFEISRLINILENFYNRIYKNQDIKKEYENNYEKNWYFNKENILNITKYLKMLIEITDKVSSVDLKRNNLPNILKKYENKNFTENSVTNTYKLLQIYSNSWMHKNILQNLNENWESFSKNKIDVFKKNEVVFKNETKKEQLERSQKRNFNNGQAIINALKLYNEIIYWSVRWVMYREFYYYQQIDGLNGLFNAIRDIKKLEDINKKIENINDKISEIKLLKYNNLKITNIDKINESFEIEKKKEEIKTVQEKFQKQVVEFKNKKLTGSLSQILHFEHFKQEKNKLKFIQLIDYLRDIHDFSRNNKNMITPSLQKIFDKHKIVLNLEFENHKVLNYSLTSKCIYLKEEQKDFELLSKNELNIYKFIINNFDS